MKHLELVEILDLLEDRLKPATRKSAESHLQACEACSGKKIWAEKTLHAMKAPVAEAPEYVFRKAAGLLGAKPAGFIDWIRASLSFDSWQSAELAGVRSAADAARQCIYTTASYKIVLMLEAQGKTGRITGQLVSQSKDAEYSHCLIEIMSRKSLIGETTTGAHGEFMLEAPRGKQLQLKIHGHPESVLISCKL